jgi:hypothetical protein
MRSLCFSKSSNKNWRSFCPFVIVKKRKGIAFSSPIHPQILHFPTLSYTFLRFDMHLKPAPHLTFLHFPTLPTLSYAYYGFHSFHASLSSQSSQFFQFSQFSQFSRVFTLTMVILVSIRLLCYFS